MGKFLENFKGSWRSIAILSIIFMVLIPIPGIMIDLLLVFSIMVSAVVYVTASSIKSWNEMSTFPIILMITAMFRIILNISTTRKILVDGDPGQVIQTAGHFVIGGNITVGIVIFLVLFVFQVIVANGSSRTAEVSARFTLDSLPGKQLSIDAELQQGILTQEQAQEKRKNLEMEVDFYGNMEGAGKFIKGDVIAGIVLTIVNIVVGLIVGIAIQGMPVNDALYHYTLLTVGDGIITQMSSLMISMGAGFVMLQVYQNNGKDLTQNLIGQLTKNPVIVLVISALFISIGAFTPLPALPFITIGAMLGYVGYRRYQQIQAEKEKETALSLLQEEEQAVQGVEQLEMVTEVDPITLEIGIALVTLIGNSKNGVKLDDKITILRKNIAKEIGIKIPTIRVIDNTSLMPYTKYNILVKDSLVGTYQLQTNSFLALKTPYTMEEIDGIATREPIMNQEAIWITEDKMQKAKEVGYSVLDSLDILYTHLNDAIRKNLHELLSRQEVKNLLDNVQKKHKVLIDEINKHDIHISVIQGVLQNLLREGISIKDLPTILEAIVDCKVHNKVKSTNIDDYTIIVREKISKQLCEKAKHKDNVMYVIVLDQEVETNMNIMERHDGYYVGFNAIEERGFMEGLFEEIEKGQMIDVTPIVLTSNPKMRIALSKMVHKYNLAIPILSTNELVPGIEMNHLGTVVQKSV